VASFHFGLPDRAAMDATRAAGCRVLSSATTVAEAEHLAQRGADAVIAQGTESGGNRGSFLVSGDDGPVGTLALVPQVVDAIGVPVIAAGGIGDGRGLAAALGLGAAGVQIGTAFLGCPETAIHPLYRNALRSTRAEATTITPAFSGRPARALRNRGVAGAGGDRSRWAHTFGCHSAISAPAGDASPLRQPAGPSRGSSTTAAPRARPRSVASTMSATSTYGTQAGRALSCSMMPPWIPSLNSSTR
jgi:nitronate monooxygenase